MHIFHNQQALMGISNTPKIRQSDDPVVCTKYHDDKG